MNFIKNNIELSRKCNDKEFSMVYIDLKFNVLLEDANVIEFNSGKFMNCVFENVNFNDRFFNDSVFEHCTFKSCNFINCQVQLNSFLEFYYCNFIQVNIMECKINNLYIKETNLTQVTFKNTFMEGSKLIGNKYEFVRFQEGCNLTDATIEDNYKFMDISFINGNSYTKLNYGTYVGRFNYKKFNKYKVKGADERISNLSISNTYMDFGGQFLLNRVSGKYGVCFYESKRAFHRTLCGKRRIISSIYNMVCGYGEKPSRTFILSFVLIIFFGVLYMVTGLKTFNNEVISINTIKGNLGKSELLNLIIYSVYFSTATFATVGYGDIIVVNTEGMVISIIEIIIGVFMIGVWTSTLVRKMTR